MSESNTFPEERLLGDEDGAPVWVHGQATSSPFLLVSDHAGRAVPDKLGDLGVSAANWERHVAWDIGIAGVGRELVRLLDTILIEQTYSRLVIDCNRSPGHPTSIVRRSDDVDVPANLNLDNVQVAAREREILLPYHERISSEIETWLTRKAPIVLVALHSFTPEMAGIARPWQAGVLFNRSPQFGLIVRDLLLADGVPEVGANEPYVLTNTSDYTVPLHAERRDLPYLELEIRQDLIETPEGQKEWAARMARVLVPAWEIFQKS